jgi:hypothetical protein
MMCVSSAGFRELVKQRADIGLQIATQAAAGNSSICAQAFESFDCLSNFVL